MTFPFPCTEAQWDALPNKPEDCGRHLIRPGDGRQAKFLAEYLRNNLPFNVKDYGATGDGITDDTAAFQAAADAAFAADGGVVVAPPGTYAISDPVVIRAGVRLIGSGVERSILDLTATGQVRWSEVALTDINGGGLSDLSVRCDIAGTAVDVSNIWGWFCHRCRIWGAGSLDNAIALRGFSFECDIRNNRITDYDTTGILFADIGGGGVYPNGTLIENNDFGGDDLSVGVAVEGASTVKIVHNYFEHALGDEGPAVTLSACKGAYIAGNWIGGNYGTSNQITVGAGTVEARIHGNHISLTGGTAISIAGAGTGYISVANNCFDVDNGVDVIVVDGRNTVSIVGNVVRLIDSGSEGVTGSVIDVKNSANDISLVGNVIYGDGAGDMPGAGIKIGNGCTSVSVLGGSIVNMTVGVDCLSASASKQVTVSGVTFSGNATTMSIAAMTAVSVRDCVGFKTAGYGNGTILNTTTSIVVNHGLAVTPPSDAVNVQCYGSSTNRPRSVWVSATSATQITIDCDGDPGASGLAVSWSYAMD
jgi:hypothetical protein